jgi:hypothetical protein
MVFNANFNNISVLSIALMGHYYTGKESFNNEGKQFGQYQQNEQLPLN